MSTILVIKERTSDMFILDDLVKKLSNLVVALPKKNRANRKEIREVILSVQTEMERAIELAILYIDGTKRIIPDQELIGHLQGASSSLLSSYNEFKICAGFIGCTRKSYRLEFPAFPYLSVHDYTGITRC